MVFLASNFKLEQWRLRVLGARQPYCVSLDFSGVNFVIYGK